jgi:DedD protein
MNSALHDSQPGRYPSLAEEDSGPEEITLGTASLIAIFFGIVLLCGVLFGVGYSFGHRSAAPSGSQPAHPASDAPSSRPATAAAPAAPKPTAAAYAADSNSGFPPDFKQPDPDGVLDNDFVPGDRSLPASARQTADSAGKIVVVRNSAPATAATHRSTAAKARPVPASSADTAAHAQLMVQVAALSQSQDAQALSAALRRHGFSPMIRHGLADSFYHVQLGPFADRPAAESMKDRLLAQGYNAILK